MASLRYRIRADLKVDMDSSTRIPTGINGDKLGDAIRICDLLASVKTY